MRSGHASLLIVALYFASLSVGCVTARERAERDVVASAMMEQRYTESCEDLAPTATLVFRDAGFALPSDKEDSSMGLSFSAGGSSETVSESSTSMSFSVGGGAPAEKKEAERAPDAVVNTSANKGGVKKRFTCWTEDRGSRISIITMTPREGKMASERDFDDEMSLLVKLQPEAAAKVRARAQTAGDEAEQ